MNVAELIEELRKYPSHKQVRVNIGTFIVETEVGDEVVCGPSEAIAAHSVVYEGAYVTIESE